MQKNKVYDIWTDGSYRDAHNIAGAGWLIRHEGAEKEGTDKFLRLTRDERRHGSDIAEIFAVVSALRTVPPGSEVDLRLDCQNVCEWLNRREITTASKRDVPALTDYFRKAIVLIEQLESFSARQVTGRMNRNLNRVHTLSQIASSPHRV